MNETECVTRGDLPHWYKPGHAHFVTYRLAESIPRIRLQEWKQERQRRIDLSLAAGKTIGQNRENAHKLFFKSYDDYLDKHADVRWLEQDTVANIVRDNLYHHNGSLYELIAWCVMPNHVHIVIQPFETGSKTPRESKPVSVTDAGSVTHVADAASIGFINTRDNYKRLVSDEIPDRASPLSRIMHSLKSYTANRANEMIGRHGRFWQTESYDHWIRDIDELERIVLTTSE